MDWLLYGAIATVALLVYIGVVLWGVEAAAFRQAATLLRDHCRTQHSPSTPCIVAITGANSGIGFELARTLAGAGARVYLGCRSEQRGAAARERILRSQPQADVRLWIVDVADPASITSAVVSLTSSERRLDALFMNAGIMPVERYNWAVAACAALRCSVRTFLETGRACADSAHFLRQPPDELVVAGAPALFATHVLGHVMLAQALRAVLPAGAKVVWTGSRAATRAQTHWQHLQPALRGDAGTGAGAAHGETYGEAKFLTDLVAPALARRMEAEVLTVCPGFVDTEMTPAFFRALLPLMRLTRVFMPGMNISPRRGIQPHVLALLAPRAALRSDVKYVCEHGRLVAATAGFCASTQEEQEAALDLVQRWLRLWRRHAGLPPQ